MFFLNSKPKAFLKKAMSRIFFKKNDAKKQHLVVFTLKFQNFKVWLFCCINLFFSFFKFLNFKKKISLINKSLNKKNKKLPANVRVLINLFELKNKPKVKSLILTR